mgnify:CR=1 FL=1
MSHTVVVTIVKTTTLNGDYSDKTNSEIIEMFQQDVDSYSLEDRSLDDESTTLDAFPTEEVI